MCPDDAETDRRQSSHRKRAEGEVRHRDSEARPADRGRGDRRLDRPAGCALRKGRRVVTCLQGTCDRHRARQVGADRPQSRGNIFEHRHAFDVLARSRSAAWRSRHGNGGRRTRRNFFERRNGRIDRAERGGETPERTANHADRTSALDARDGERHRARYRREGRSVLAESRADRVHGGRARHGRRARDRARSNAAGSSKTISPRSTRAGASARNCAASRR